jgi:hypothetical protein
MSAFSFVYCFAKIHQKERICEKEGRLTYLWLIVLVFLFMLYGLHTWGVYPLPSHVRVALPTLVSLTIAKRLDQRRDFAIGEFQTVGKHANYQVIER